MFPISKVPHQSAVFFSKFACCCCCCWAEIAQPVKWLPAGEVLSYLPTMSRPALRPTQPPILGGKPEAAWSWPLTSIWHPHGLLSVLWPRYVLEDRGSIAGIRRGTFFLHHRVQIGWCPPSLLSNRYRGSFPVCIAAGAWSWHLTCIQCRG
jgi:hypothetical protein